MTNEAISFAGPTRAQHRRLVDVYNALMEIKVRRRRLKYLKAPYKRRPHLSRIRQLQERIATLAGRGETMNRFRTSGIYLETRGGFGRPFHLSIGVDRNEQTHTHTKRLFVSAAERIAVGRFNKPSEFSILGRPDHEIQCELGTQCPAAAVQCLTPLGSGPDHELYLIGQREGLFEQEVTVPMGLALAEQWAGANLDLEPIFDRLKLNRR
jgi:hypothetical protein